MFLSHKPVPAFSEEIFMLRDGWYYQPVK